VRIQALCELVVRRTGEIFTEHGFELFIYGE
jgi:hypothetical protein